MSPKMTATPSPRILRLSVWGGLTCLFCLAIILMGMRGTEWQWTYPLDDTYIHLSMARTIASAGVWGVQASEPAFCSSSPLWTILLSVFFKLFAYCESLPGILSILFAAGTLAVFADMLRMECRGLRIACLVTTILALPIAVIGTLGMEHSLHVFLTILLCMALHRFLKSENPSRATYMQISIFGLLATAVRTESLFLIMPMVLVLLQERRWRATILLVAASVVPLVAYGVYALVNGGHFLPNSLLLKGSFHTVSSLLWTVLRLPFGIHAINLHLYLMAMLMFSIWAFCPTEQRKLAFCVFLAIGEQLVFVQYSNFYRYDAFLIASAAYVVFLDLSPFCPFPWQKKSWRHIILSTLLLLTISWLTLRGAWASNRAVQAPANIYGQQVQLARLFAGLPNEARGTIALNDLGYLSLHANAPIIDLWGLGTQEIADMKVLNEFNARSLMAVLARRNVKFIAVFEEWIPRSMLPTTAIQVGKLSIKNNHVCLSPDVWLYATSVSAAEALRRRMHEFKSQVPNQTTLTTE